MRKLTFGMNLSLDGYIAAPGGDLGWSVPSDRRASGPGTAAGHRGLPGAWLPSQSSWPPSQWLP